jgi:TolA-binding protein
VKQVIERVREKASSFQPNDDADIREKLADLIQNRDYSTAIDLIMVEMEKGKQETTYDEHYVASINGLIKSGMEYYADEDYGRAGIAFTKAIDNYPSSRSLTASIKLSSRQIKSYIKKLTDKLMGEGLKEYRSGNLGNAISTWREIIEYHPDHSEANKMIDITTIQMKNLKKIE